MIMRMTVVVVVVVVIMTLLLLLCAHSHLLLRLSLDVLDKFRDSHAVLLSIDGELALHCLNLLRLSICSNSQHRFLVSIFVGDKEGQRCTRNVAKGPFS